MGKAKRPDMNKEDPGQDAAPKKKRAHKELGRALRSVYDETLREDVPDDFLDLLGKLS